MGEQVAPGVVPGVGMRVEMDDPEPPRSDRFSHRARGREGDRVVAAEHDRDRAGACHLEHACPDHLVAALETAGDDRHVAPVDDVEPVERVHPGLQRVDVPGVVRRRADGPWPEPGAGPVAHPVIERSAEDHHIRAPLGERADIGQERKLLEGRAAEVRGQVEIVPLVQEIRAVRRCRVAFATTGQMTITHGIGPVTGGRRRGAELARLALRS